MNEFPTATKVATYLINGKPHNKYPHSQAMVRADAIRAVEAGSRSDKPQWFVPVGIKPVDIPDAPIETMEAKA